jgi:hypothetical protein
MDHPPGGQVSRRRPAGVAGDQSLREASPTVFEHGRAARSVDGSVDARTPAHGPVGGIDQSVYPLPGDVAVDEDETKALHVTQSAVGPR